MAGRIAVIVTCRDLGGMLLEALDSVDRQTRPPHEIVVVDDRSTDFETVRIVAQLRTNGTCVVTGPGRGASAARNLGASMTSSEYLVCLDGDDTLEPGYFAAAADRLDREDVDFVSSAMRAFGEASYTWTPSPPRFVDAVSTGGVPHASTMVRRALWTALDGFDEEVPSFELLDFWTSALERGFRGVILQEPFINYRIRAESGYRRSIQQATYLSRMRHFYAKHRDAIERHGAELLPAKEAFFISQRNYWRSLESRAASLEAELHERERQIAEAVQALEQRGVPRSAWNALIRRPDPPAAARPGRAAIETVPARPRRLDERPPRAVILAYHRVATLNPDSHGLCVAVDVFRDQMTWIRDHLTPVSLDELVGAAAADCVPHGAVAVTLDDGYLDALNTVSPILTELGIPATFFINSERVIEPHERWWDILERVFLPQAALPPMLMLDVDGERCSMPTGTDVDRSSALEWLNRTLWPRDERSRTAIVERVLAWAGVNPAPRDSHRVLTADEIRELASRPGHCVGAHTIHHLALTVQPPDTKRREIVDNKSALEHIVERPVGLFSYPYGDFDADTVAVVRDAGFRGAVTIDDGFVSAGSNRLLLPRYEIGPRRQRDLSALVREAIGELSV